MGTRGWASSPGCPACGLSTTRGPPGGPPFSSSCAGLPGLWTGCAACSSGPSPRDHGDASASSPPSWGVGTCRTHPSPSPWTRPDARPGHPRARLRLGARALLLPLGHRPPVLLAGLTAVEVVMMMILHLSLSFSKFSNFGQFAATFRGATYDLAGSIGKRSIFGLDTTTNR